LQRKGNLQHSPQLLQLPCLFLSTGRSDVRVRVSLGIIAVAKIAYFMRIILN